MKVLVINCGSSSIKYQLFKTDADQVLAKGIVSRIGEEGSYVKHEAGNVKLHKEVPGLSYARAFELIVQKLLDQNYGVIKDILRTCRRWKVCRHQTPRATNCRLAIEMFAYQVKKPRCFSLHSWIGGISVD